MPISAPNRWSRHYARAPTWWWPGVPRTPRSAIAPLVHHFGWTFDDWEKLAVGAACGHLLECGSQVTGGVFWDPGFKDIPDPANIGFPIAQVTAEGGLVITKPEDTGGLVDLRTIKEQLLYELHDPSRYIADVVLDISGCSVEQVGKDRVAVHGLRGHPRPETLKVTASFEGSWLGEGGLRRRAECAGPRQATADVLQQPAEAARSAVRARVDLIGIGRADSDDARSGAAMTGRNRRNCRASASPPGRRPRRGGPGGAGECCPALLWDGGHRRRRWRLTPRILTRSYLVFGNGCRPRGRAERAGHGRPHRAGDAGMTIPSRSPLHAVAHSRAGDKGNRSNLSLDALRPGAVPYAADRAEPGCWRCCASRARRLAGYDLPLLQAFNFVVDDVLEGGVNGSLNLDSHGKTQSFRLLSLTVRVPRALAKP